MSRSDTHRWTDWRTSRRQPLRQTRRCECGREFLPDVERQVTCRVCCGLAEAADQAPMSADHAERERVARLLQEALADDARHKPIPLAQPPSDQEKLWRNASRRTGVSQQHHRKRGKPARGMTNRKAKVALKSLQSGMSIRKVSKRLGISEQVVRDWAILTAEDMRYRAACDGKYATTPETPQITETAGDTYWTRAKQESRCPRCRSMIFTGEQISLIDRRWIHATCAATAGFAVLDRDGSLADLEAA